MARTATKSAIEMATAVDTVDAAVADISVAENKDVKDIENEVKEDIVKKNVVKKAASEPITDSDEIDVISLIPNVSYKDSKTGDMYEWDKSDHIEPMTFETLKNMWRNNKGYFRNMWLKPLDDRVINKFGLTKVFGEYDFLMDEDNYTRENADKLCDIISKTPNGLKYSIINKIKNMITIGKLSDISVIRKLEKRFNLDLFSLLD